MISFAEPLPVGNAVRILLSPATGSTEWRLLRKTTGTFTDQDDPDAGTIYSGDDQASIVDTATLTNGTPYYYCLFEFNGTVWTATPVVSVTPAADFGQAGPDVLSLIRDRLDLGLRAATIAGTLKHDNDYIPVLTAPPLYENTKWPVVSVHLQNDAAGERAIGEEVGQEGLEAGEWEVSEGWLSQVRLQIIGWSLNPDERIALRKAIKAIIIGNLPVFDSVGIILPTLSQMDVEDFESYAAPVYQTIGDFNCVAPSVITSDEDSVSDVTVEADVEPDMAE